MRFLQKDPIHWSGYQTCVVVIWEHLHAREAKEDDGELFPSMEKLEERISDVQTFRDT